MAFVNLPRVAVSKPWGRYDLPSAFGDTEGRIGEIWFDDPSDDLPLLVKWLFTSEKGAVSLMVTCMRWTQKPQSGLELIP